MSEDHLRQKDGRKRTRMVKSSRRPMIISRESRSLATGLSQSKSAAGPIWPTPGPTLLSKGVEIRQYDVIYHATEQIQKALLGLLEPTFHEEETGIAEVRMLFKLPSGVVAGSHVVSGEIHRTDKVRVMRGKEVVFDGDIQTLRHLKDDVKEVRSGYDCGVVLNGFNEFAEGDKLHAYKMVQDGLTE